MFLSNFSDSATFLLALIASCCLFRDEIFTFSTMGWIRKQSRSKKTNAAFSQFETSALDSKPNVNPGFETDSFSDDRNMGIHRIRNWDKTICKCNFCFGLRISGRRGAQLKFADKFAV